VLDESVDLAGLFSTRLADFWCYDIGVILGSPRLKSLARSSSSWSCWILALALCAPQFAGADVVYLTNGRSMEGIVLEESNDQVLIKLAFGEIGLPRSSILRIERGPSDLEEYLERRARLVERDARAGDWLQLAGWADSQGLDHGAREAAMRAAQIEPDLPALAPWMESYGYVYSPEESRWLPYDEFMRRRGFVQSGDRWITAGEALAERLAQDEANRRRQEALRQDRLARAMEMMALAQIAQAEENRRRLEETPVYPVGIPIYGGYPVVVQPWNRPQPPHTKPGHHSRPPRDQRQQYPRDELLRRPPGSWIPLEPPVETNRGGIQKESGSGPP
jgi:hypothetical protein